MPVPTTYSEAELATFLLDELGPMAPELKWTGVVHVQRPINTALRECGVVDITQVTGAEACAKLEAFALRALWRRVVNYLATEHDFDTDGQSFKRSQLQTLAKTALDLAEADVETLAGDEARELIVGLTSLTHPHDPYAYVPDENRTLP